MSEPPWLEFLYSALRSEKGVCITVSDFERARAKLYEVRRGAADPALAVLSLIQSPTASNELWIVRKEPPNGES